MSSARYIITAYRMGVQFETRYAGSVKGAMSKARERGFEDGDYRNNQKPVYTQIWVRYDSSWELVATVSKDKVEVVKSEDRPSYKHTKLKIKYLETELAEMDQVFEKLTDEAAVHNFNSLTGAT
jgi:hypothetical protein